MVIVRSHVAFPSPGQTDNHEADGYSLFDEEIAATKAVMGLPADKSFYVPDAVLSAYRAAGRQGAAERSAWQQRVEALAPCARSMRPACRAGGCMAGRTSCRRGPRASWIPSPEPIDSVGALRRLSDWPAPFRGWKS